MVSLAHLDRGFDYLIPADLDGSVRSGVRVRVRFAGRLVDGFVLERLAESDHDGRLGWLERVPSREPVLTDEIAELAASVARRYAGTRADVLRLAIPPRHARAESSQPRGARGEGQRETGQPDGGEIDSGAWGAYLHAPGFLQALGAGRGPRATWQALPGEQWAVRLAELASVTARSGRSAIIVVPDQRDLDEVAEACAAVAPDQGVVALSASLGPAARYSRWLAALRGTASIVVGTRSAVFAPVQGIGLIAVWDDGDDNHAEPRAPYPHAREVALLRAHQTGCALVLGGYARTAEAQALVESGWARDLVASRDVVRERMPRVRAPGDSDVALERDPLARSARIPAAAFGAARAALEAGRAVLVQVPRTGYVPALACARCRMPARCRRCAGPLSIPTHGPEHADGAAGPVCRWCAHEERAYRCAQCGARALRAQVIGARRTAEEIGRAFPGVAVVSSGGEDVRGEVPARASIVVATVGAEPRVDGGYGAVLLLDGWSLLTRADLRAAEEALRRWMNAAALARGGGDGGEVIIVAAPEIAPVQALVRWDPVGHAAAELAGRREVGFPPAVHIAAVDAAPDVLSGFLAAARLPEGVEVLGPAPLPANQRPPAGREPDGLPAERVLLRVPRRDGIRLADRLSDTQSARSARRESASVRVQIDPIRIG